MRSGMAALCRPDTDPIAPGALDTYAAVSEHAPENVSVTSWTAWLKCQYEMVIRAIGYAVVYGAQ